MWEDGERLGISLTAGTIYGGKRPPPPLDDLGTVLINTLYTRRKVDSPYTHFLSNLYCIIITEELNILTWTVMLNQAMVVLSFYISSLLTGC